MLTQIICLIYSQQIQADLVPGKDRGSSTTTLAQVSRGRDKMSKRKKPHTSGTSGGERVYSPKCPKKPRLDDSDGAPQSPKLDCFPALDKSEGKVGPTPPAEHSKEELRPAAPSSPDEETEVPSRLLGQPEKDPVPFALSQNSGRKFVPQFAKARKTVTRKAETKEEDIRSGAFNLETLQEPSAPQTGSQQLHASPGLAFPEEGAPEDQAQATGIHPEQHSQLPPESVLGGGASLPMTSTDGSSSWRMVASASERASQEHLSEPGTRGGNSGLESGVLEAWQGNSRPGTERGLAPEGPRQKGPPRSSESEGKEPHRGAPQKEGEGVPGALGPDPARGLIPVSQGPEPGSAAQGCPNHMHMPSRPVVVIAKGSTDPTVPPPGAPEPARWAPNSSCSVALPHSLEAVGGPGEVGPEDEPPGDTLRPPAASQAPAHQSQEPTVGGGDSSPITLEVGPGVDLKQTASPGQEELGGAWVLPSPEPVGGKAAEPGSESQPDPEPSGCSLSLRAASPPEHTEVVDGLSQGPRAHTALDPADQAVWGGSSPVELDFLPDSQIQDALDAPNFEAPPEQPSPVGSRLSPCWPDTNPPTDRALITTARPRTQDTGNKAFEAPRLEDATDIVCGLIMELSNLNRLIMSTHRDLEAFKRLSYRKGKPAGKAPVPYASKGAGNLPRGKQPWRDL
ncbi:LOW QUALITY PROTEIN: break repair meiotic recombinase recruitment factor 1 [Elephas maximus indicus]|uniref:LOW QUALITY PROTEIN: break repair meiotic recombinase recruitment factor 1 n=1 Tax=Elephas maximus indicus TaxID=99487 RepID=UPI002116C087|nr:LOW QUALITY PROTEIN: break repair meiotic recombinase recruitment factor 1 [Elephas maximus indicus]